MDKLNNDNTTIITLTKGQRVIFNLFLSAMKKGESKVVLPTRINSNSIIYFIKLVIAEYPELCQYDTCSCSYLYQGNSCIVKLNPAFGNRAMANELNAKARRILDSIIVEKTSDIKKVLCIHDYLINNVTYRETELNSFNISHTAYGAIVNNEAVCEGIAYGFSYLLKMSGVKATVVDGKADDGAHAWNIVKIDSDCYHFDVTWDLIRKGDQNNMIYDYFCLCDSDLNERVWDRKIYPQCPSRKYNYFVLSNSFAHSENELIRIMERQYPKYNAVYLKYDYFNYDRDKAMNYLWSLFLKTAQKQGWSVGSLHYAVNDDQSIFTIS